MSRHIGQSRSWSIDALYGLGIAAIIFAIGTIIISTNHHNKISINASTSAIADLKAQFLGSTDVVKNDDVGELKLQKEFILQLDNIPLPGSGVGAIVPIDLSVNFLQRIKKATGAPPIPPLVAHAASNTRVDEEFLPVVPASDVNFRWRHRAKEGSSYKDASIIKAYRVIVRQYQHASIKSTHNFTVWDSGKVIVDSASSEESHSVRWGSDNAPTVGHILEWMVQVWDNNDKDCASSWTKFAVGPDKDDWIGKWIVHPHDMLTFDTTSKLHTKLKIFGDLRSECRNWKKRRPLPLFRMKLLAEEWHPIETEQTISSALLVISGLGSFRVSFDGVPLSTSGPIDPPFTDYSKRIMYRGFDITPFLLENPIKSNHVIGVTMGSGWFDHRPVTGMAKPHFLPRGPVTIIAQIFITYSSGETRVVAQTSDHGASWQVARGYIRESDLFTGEMVDLSILAEMEGWDTTRGWVEEKILNDGNDPYENINTWLKPVTYRTDVTHAERKQEMAVRSLALPEDKAKTYPKRKRIASPLGQLVPSEIPPILPMERIAPDEVHDLGSGRWLLDFGKAFSGMLHFDDGLPHPIIPPNKAYPRAHGFREATEKGWPFITVVYGESLELTTGDINRVLVAGMGLHDGGPRHETEPAGAQNDTFCFPKDHDGTLTQRDVYFYSSNLISADKIFPNARQSHFTTHAFRFAEICCTSEPPSNVSALMYRTAMQEWGTFDSSSVLLNGGYELVKNSLRSNLLSVQSDCPHREKLPYGGDLIANSPSAMHMFDMSAFYKKTIRDWMDAQWDNGAYTETSVWQDLNDYAGIGKGAGETVWATAPPVLTVRHMQHYGDLDLLEESYVRHKRWLEFLNKEFDSAMIKMGYDTSLKTYKGDGSGLGDWLALQTRDTYLTHTAFYMAASRCVAYIANKLGNVKMRKKGVLLAELMRNRISRLYLLNGRDNFNYPMAEFPSTPGPELSLFTRIVPGEKRCNVLKNWFRRKGETWEGDEEKLFLKELDTSYKKLLVKAGVLIKDDGDYVFSVSQWQGFGEGIFAIRYSLKTLSDMGYHHIALRKASGIGFGTTEYMLSHNATTMWESWWRSEDLYSRNHPMLGAIAEWMSSSVAGISLHPTTVGGKQVLFWPRFPKSATMLKFASSTQGTPVGDFAIAWRFEDLPDNIDGYDSALVTVRIRLLVPPGGTGILRLPIVPNNTKIRLSHTNTFPDIGRARDTTNRKCTIRRNLGHGFHWNWEYNRHRKKWYTHKSKKSIGTACESFLFALTPEWAGNADVTLDSLSRVDRKLQAGLYDVIITDWKLEKEVEGTGRLGNIPEYFHPDFYPGPYCSDRNSFDWHIDDATHII